VRRWQLSMQCYLAWCCSFRRDFTLEPFTRGLAGEHAYQHAQRFVAMIARCTSSHSASMLPTALVSRPDHNAQLPREVHVCAPAEPIGDLTGRHHVIARQRAEPQARSSPPARKGRSKAEWLDRAEGRRTISRCDGRTLERRRCSARERTRRTRRARLGNSREVTARCRLRRRFSASARSLI
jgi:hypothetical protein